MIIYKTIEQWYSLIKDYEVSQQALAYSRKMGSVAKLYSTNIQDAIKLLIEYNTVEGPRYWEILSRNIDEDGYCYVFQQLMRKIK